MKSYNFLKPTKLPNGVQLKNKIVLAPMTEHMAFEDGTITTDEINYMEQRSGGVGLFITPVAYINKEGKGFEGQLGIEDDDKIAGLTKLASVIKAKGAKAVLQIFSAGRMTNSAILRGLKPVSASAIAAERPNAEIPRELSLAEVDGVIHDFAEATRRAIIAGFDGIELHGANTYLLQQFFSPHSNRRQDKWGGSLENRLKFPLAVIDAVLKVKAQYKANSFIIGYRLSPEEIEEPGITLEDTKRLVAELQNTEIDYVHLSLGNIWRTSLRNKEDKTPIITQLKTICNKKPLIGVGNIRTPEQAEDAINQNIDLIAMGHQLIIEPKWVEKVISGHEENIRYELHAADLEDLGIKSPLLKLIRNMPGFDIKGLDCENMEKSKPTYL